MFITRVRGLQTHVGTCWEGPGWGEVGEVGERNAFTFLPVSTAREGGKTLFFFQTTPVSSGGGDSPAAALGSLVQEAMS